MIYADYNRTLIKRIKQIPTGFGFKWICSASSTNPLKSKISVNPFNPFKSASYSNQRTSYANSQNAAGSVVRFGQLSSVELNRILQSEIQCIADKRVADRHFQQARYVLREETQVFKA
jgi:hypothetical protein